MIHKFLPGVVLCVLGLPVLAETPLTWEASVREAAAHNPDLRTARANLDSARYQWRGNYSGFLPQLSAAGTYSDTTSPTTSTSTPTYAASVSITQNLFAGFLDQAKVAQGEADYSVSEASLAQAAARLNHDLRTAFAGLLYAQENVRLTAAIEQRLQENLRLVELRYEGGRENKGSYLLTKAQLSQARYENLQARQAIASSQAQFARVLGREPSEGLRVTGAVPLGVPESEPKFSLLAEQTPDVRGAAAQERSAAAGIAVARAPLYPSLNLTGSTVREGESWFPGDHRRTVGVTLSVPIFTGGKDYYGTRSAIAAHAASVTSKESVGRQVLVRLKQTHAAFVEAVEKLKVDEDFLEAAVTRADIARAKYQNGLISFEDWDRIENDLILRQKTLLASRRERVTAEAVWELTLGRGLP